MQQKQSPHYKFSGEYRFYSVKANVIRCLHLQSSKLSLLSIMENGDSAGFNRMELRKSVSDIEISLSLQFSFFNILNSLSISHSFLFLSFVHFNSLPFQFCFSLILPFYILLARFFHLISFCLSLRLSLPLPSLNLSSFLFPFLHCFFSLNLFHFYPSTSLFSF